MVSTEFTTDSTHTKFSGYEMPRINDLVLAYATDDDVLYVLKKTHIHD